MYVVAMHNSHNPAGESVVAGTSLVTLRLRILGALSQQAKKRKAEEKKSSAPFWADQIGQLLQTDNAAGPSNE